MLAQKMPDAPHFEIQKDFKGEYIWVLVSARGDEIARSGTSHKMLPKCTKAITMAKEMMAAATVTIPCHGRDGSY